MADLTQNAVDGLLSLLTSAVKDEARLLGGVQGNVQFIKDEMDSMYGFLMHLTKTETEHNDQHRAWMKQVRDISYVAQDCIELYLRDLGPPEDGFRSKIRHLPVLVRTYCKRRNLAKQLRELKDRVREVGERRQRYGVSVPEKAVFKPEQAGKRSNDDEKMESFLCTLEEDAKASPASFSKAINDLPGDIPSETRDKLKKTLGQCADVYSNKMFLCALFAYPHVTEKEVETNLKKLTEGGEVGDLRKEVMLFSYSKLSRHYKSCLQYLTAFREESSISRTSLVRRWIAEGLVARDDGQEQTMEEAGERCFNQLVFQGFVRPAPPAVPGHKIKSCCVHDSVWDFVFGMAKSENFVGAVPTHLVYQRRIREIAKREPPPQQQTKQILCPSWNICPRKQQLRDENDNMTTEDKPHPMDEMAHFLQNLPEEYRLNVLDLGGCRTLKDCHLEGIVSKVPWLKYLSIRNTEVSRLPKKINNLRRLETLDIRQTNIKATDTTHIVLLVLKHLLAGHINECHEIESVQMPCKIAKTMEVLRYVQILKGKAELDLVGTLKQLRKLGVVIQGSKGNMTHLDRTINKLGECLRSLSVWITVPDSKDETTNGDGIGIGLDGNQPSSPPKNLESLNLKYLGGNSGCLLPSWIKQQDKLSKITLRNTQLSDTSLRTLGELKSLRCLRLCRGSYDGDSITLVKGEFQKLRFLLISDQVIKDNVTNIARISFQEGAAPMLEKITWTLDEEKETKEDTISGIKYLESFEELELNGWVDLQGHVKKVLADHPKRRPRLTCARTSQSFEVTITEMC